MPKIRKPGPDTASPPSPKETEGTTAPEEALINTELASDLTPSTPDEATGQRLTIPDVSGLGVLEAALAYAACGWFVGPVRRDLVKNPGGVLGKCWHDKTSRDEATIRRWFEGRDDRGLFLHVGRSGDGAVAFDVDHPQALPEALLDAIADLNPPYQATRTDEPGRGHYLFATPGVRYGNGLGRLPKGWGEVRGLNGIVVVEPTTRPEPGKIYAWERTGELPDLPQALADALNPACNLTEAASSDEVRAFLDGHRSDALESYQLMDVHLNRFERDVSRGASRHDSMRDELAMAMKDARAGLLDAPEAVEKLKAAFEASLADDRDRDPEVEFEDLLAWAVPKALGTDPASHRAKLAERFPDIVAGDAAPRPAKVSPSASDGTDGPEAAQPTKKRRMTVADIYAGDLGVTSPNWERRPELRLIRRAALARGASPVAVLGSVLLRVIAAAGPELQLPPLVGGNGNLNTFICFVGESGQGKGAAEEASEALFTLKNEPMTRGVGSGEGLAKLFTHYEKGASYKNDEGKRVTDPPQLVWDADRAILSAPEVGTLQALSARQGGTLFDTLKQAWSGSRLGFQNGGVETRSHVPKHSYRLCLSVGAQPRNCDVLLKDTTGGTPQRFLWLPAGDPTGNREMIREARRSRVEPVPLPEHWALPPGCALGEERPVHVMPVPDEVSDAIWENRDARLLCEDVEPLAGHRLYAQEKLAAGFALLDDRSDVNLDDWDLAAWLMEISTRTLAYVESELREAKDERAGEAGRTRAIENAAARVEAGDARFHYVRRQIEEKVTKAGGEMGRRDLVKSFRSGERRREAEGVLDEMVAAGMLTEFEVIRSGNKAVWYRLA